MERNFWGLWSVYFGLEVYLLCNVLEVICLDGRVFEAKRGHYIKKDKVESAIDEVFGDYEEVGDGRYLVDGYMAFKSVEIEVLVNKNKKNRLMVNTESDMDKAELALDSKRDLDSFLEIVTGYTPKERMKKAKDKAKKS